MGKPLLPAPVKLFTGVLFSDETRLNSVKQVLEQQFGPVDCMSETFPFDLTEYYHSEMGDGIRRCFWSFERLTDPGNLAEIKLFTNEVEESFCGVGGGRLINLDPGYIDFYKLVLASVKERGQKIYLTGGVYADPTLYYLKGRWYSYEWSLPDFKRSAYYPIFQEIRGIYRRQMRAVNLDEIRFKGF